MTNGTALQSPFLDALQQSGSAVSVFLVNGIKLQGQVSSFDENVLFLKNTITQMIYKHAISTIVPNEMPTFSEY